jgi:hypothetical protein
VYDTLAEVYDWLVPETLLEPEASAAAFETVIDRLPDGARVLDCAAGTGTLAVGLALRVIDLGEREALLQGQPGAFFSTPHYDGYPYVLVRLEAVDPEELAELIEDAWRIRAPKRLVKAYDAER